MSPHPLSPFRLERWFVEFEFVPGIRNLTASGPYDATTQEVLALEGEETTERYLQLGLGYSENSGSEQLRHAVASLYTTLSAGDIQITSGASEALFLLPWVVMEPDANIVVEEPCYENLPGVASALGFEVRRLPLRMEDGWKPDLDQLARLIDENTRLIYLVHPHNPTGSTLQVEEMQAIARMAEREEAALRELYEETGLKGSILRFLFTLPYDLGTSTIFRVEVDSDAQVVLGYDPEEVQEEQKMLEEVAWFSIQDVRGHPEVRR